MIVFTLRTNSTEKEHIYQSEGVIPLHIAERGITNVEYYIAQYDGGISFTDEQIGVLLEELEELGLDRKTIIILTADHGEAMGEHNVYFTHGGFLYNEFIKVPLIFKYSNILPTAKVINHQVGLIDIMPTLLDILGIQIKTEVSGISFLPMILKGKSHSSRIIFSELFTPVGEPKSTLKSLRIAGWKLIYNSSNEKYELYNLRADPQELNNLVEIKKEQFEFLKAKLEEWMNRPRPNVIPVSRKLAEEEKERLRSLGYLQ